LKLDTLLQLRAGPLMTCDAYLDLMAAQADTAPPAGDAVATERVQYTRPDGQRSRRIARTRPPATAP